MTSPGGRVVAVTGAGAGLGRSYALALAADGAAVIVNDVDAAAAAAVVHEIERTGGRATADGNAVGDAAAADRIVRTAVDTYGRLDVMVTNAGADRRGPALDLTSDDWEYTLGVHLWGTIHCAIAAGRVMRERGGGSIVTVTSAAYHAGTATMAPYCVAKGGIYSLTRVLAMELAPFGVRVNAVAPPLTATAPALAFVESLAEMGAGVEQVAAIRSMIEQPDQVAPIVVYLASDRSRALSGHVFTLTAGEIVSLGSPDTRSVARGAPHEAPWSLDELDAAMASLATP